MSNMSPESLSEYWGMAPALATPRDFSLPPCALWAFSADGPVEVIGEADPANHVISMIADGWLAQDYFGDGQLKFSRRCRPGAVNIVRAGETPRAILAGERKRFSVFHIYLPRSLVGEIAAEDAVSMDPDQVELVDPLATVDPGIERVARELMSEVKLGTSLSLLRMQALYQDLTIQLLRRHSNLSGVNALRPGSLRGGLSPWQLKRACEAMEAHIDEDIGLDMLAGIAGCSPTHFSRAFKQSTGMPPFQWLLERRIERAKYLLQDSGISLAEVALSVGFAAQPQFTTAFRRVTGATPGAWRRERLT